MPVENRLDMELTGIKTRLGMKILKTDADIEKWAEIAVSGFLKAYDPR